MAKSRTRASNAGKKRNPRNPWLVLRRSKIQGQGVFARKDIPRGTRLIEYVGERINNAEADRRYEDELMGRHHTFLFILNSRTVIDAAVGGNISRYINHSCAPNCVAWIEGQHIWIDALRDIREEEELAYDYEYDFLPEYTVEDLETYACHCGSRKCRYTIVDVPRDKRHLIAQLKRRRRAAAAKLGQRHRGRRPRAS